MTRTGLATLLLLVGLAGNAAAKPPGLPPKVGGAPGAPPPAWIGAGAVHKWLAYSSYCWKIACVDFVSPSQRRDIPVLTVRRGQRVLVHLGFAPSELSVTQGAKTTRLASAAVARWLPRSGVAMFFARPKAGGDVSYLVRIRVR
jgi:hydrogenase maturation factor